jgi:nitroreductase / dihydropteridine reductase
MDFLKSLQWRYAVKAFDTTRKLDDALFEKLLEATRLSPSGFGQQPFKVIVVKNQALRDSLVAFSNGQDKVANASHLVIFAAQTDLGDGSVDNIVSIMSEAQQTPIENFGWFGNLVKGIFKSKSPEALVSWAKNQVFIGLGVLLSACAIEEVDASPMEGFNPEKFDEILGLKEKNLTSTVIVALGYRSPEDKFQHLAKFRKAYADFVEILN